MEPEDFGILNFIYTSVSHRQLFSTGSSKLSKK